MMGRHCGAGTAQTASANRKCKVPKKEYARSTMWCSCHTEYRDKAWLDKYRSSKKTSLQYSEYGQNITKPLYSSDCVQQRSRNVKNRMPTRPTTSWNRSATVYQSKMPSAYLQQPQQCESCLKAVVAYKQVAWTKAAVKSVTNTTRAATTNSTRACTLLCNT